MIVGAGIAGLAAAIGLTRVGYEVRILERRKDLERIGAGISLWPNALRALDLLGLGAVVRSAGAIEAESGIRAPDGSWLARIDLAEMSHRLGPLVVLHRRDLIAALYDAIPPDVIRFGVEATAFAETTSSVTINHANGTETADLVIGADGVRSTVRKLLWSDAEPPLCAGYAAWRFVTSLPSPPSGGSETWGNGERFGYAPLPRGLTYAFAAARTSPRSNRDGGGLAELCERFSGWHAPIPDLLAGARESEVLRSDIEEVVNLSTYVRGRVALIGDAAHAMSPNLGQGACQALEDAVTLSLLLGGQRKMGDALSAYDLLRRPRSQMVARRSAQLGHIAQWESKPLVMLRSALLRASPGSVRQRSLERIARWQPPEGPNIAS